MHTIETILKELIRRPSVTPFDAGCQGFMIQTLEQLGFHCQSMDNLPVSNFFARLGTQEPCLVFAGHTDVVPVGDETQWRTPPFELTNQNGFLYGRGVADMKGSLACMMVAAERFVASQPHFTGSLCFLMTSGEEGNDYHLGTPYVMAQLKAQGIHPDYCIVGEPSSTTRIGDTIKIGRRGSLNAQIIVQGKQGHVAYPHLANNPIHALAPVLSELTSRQWDEGNAYFPPTSFQITRLQSGGHANNIIPGELFLDCNIRYSTEQTAETLMHQVETCFAQHNLQTQFNWRLSGEPFLTETGRLLDCCVRVIHDITGQAPDLSTSGGTSDGRFIAPFGVEVVELGPVNATIHQVNECVSLSDLNTLSELYYAIAIQLLHKQ